MQRDIALIADEDWQAGPERVAERIAEIELRYAVNSSPNAEEIKREADGTFFRVPLTTIRPDLFKGAKEKIGDDIAEIRAKPVGNTFSPLVDDLSRLEDHLDRYANEPLRIHDVFQKTIRHIDLKLASGELARHELVEDLRQDLDTGAIDIRRADTEVAKTIKSRAADRIARMKAEDKAGLDRTMTLAASESRADLKAEIIDDIATTNDPKAELQDRDESRYRLASRGLRMAKRRKDDLVKAADDAGKIARGAEAAQKVYDSTAPIASGWWGWILDKLPSIFG